MEEARKLNWGPTLFLAGYQIVLLICLPFYFYYAPPSLAMCLAAFILLYLTGLSITAGYHRLYSHKAYRTNPAVEAVILFFGAMASQGSALQWTYDHRLHHAHVDTDRDPYTITKGFWYAHFMWILEPVRPVDAKVVPDLLKNKLVMFQHRWIGTCMIVTNALAFLAVGLLLNDFVGAFFLALWTRMSALHNFTWFINSLAHTWGDKPFSQEQTAVDNYILSILTFGEGYHNYHHTFANDYRNGIRWYHFDPTKWLIWSMQKLGLARDLKRMSPYTIKRKMVLEHKNLLLERIRKYWNARAEELETQVNEISERIVHKIAEFTQLKERYQELLKETPKNESVQSLREELNNVSKSLQADTREWAALSRSILKAQ